GFSGLSILADYSLGIPLWATNLVLNIPLFIVAGLYVNRKLVWESLLSTGVYSVSVALLPDRAFLEGDLFLSAILGGMAMGIGLGLILYTGASSGGVDMLSIIIHHKNNRISVPWIMFILDAVIILMGGLIFGWVKAMYSVISVWIVSFITEKITDGPNYSKACIIISRKNEVISGRIMKELERGVTGIDGTGLYTGNREMLLFCVSSRHEMTNIRRIVYSEDPAAFMTVSNVSEVFGEGFVKK
ncbi:MAG: YitT family protein, partial [Butyrivibrio sp.]